MRLALIDLTVKYDSVIALDGLSLSLPTGVRLAVFGRSGSGKTTLLKVLSGIQRPTSGELWYDDHCVNGLAESEMTSIRASRFGFVFQDHKLLPYLTAYENVMVSTHLRSGGLSAGDALSEVGLDSRRDHLPHELSGGEQQRVGIARALCGSPAVIFADEPTGSLDDHNAQLVLDLLLGATKQLEISLLLVSHRSEIRSRFDRVVELDHGQIIVDA